MSPTPATMQRKHGVTLFKPVAWNEGRRFTSPGPGIAGQAEKEGHNLLYSEVSVSECKKLGVFIYG